MLSQCRPFERVPITSVSALGSSLMETYPILYWQTNIREIDVHGEHGGLMAAHGGGVFLSMSGTDSKGIISVRHVPGLCVVFNRQGTGLEPFGLILTGGMSTQVDEHTMMAYVAVHGGCAFFRGF